MPTCEDRTRSRTPRRGRLGAIALLALAASAALAGTAEALPTGTVLYAYRTPYTYPQGPYAPGVAQGRVALTATYDGCASGPQPCSWLAVSWAARSGCAPDLFNDPYPWAVWGSARQYADGTVASGEQRFLMGTPNEIELHVMCLYVVRENPGGEDEPTLVGLSGFSLEPTGSPPAPGTPEATPGPQPGTPGAPPETPGAGSAPPSGTSPATPGATPALQSGVVPPPAVAPSGEAPTVLPVLTNLRARRAARARLARRYGSWRRGARKHVGCRRASATRYSCTATWRYKGERRGARLTVVLRDGVIVARLR